MMNDVKQKDCFWPNMVWDEPGLLEGIALIRGLEYDLSLVLEG